MHERLQALRETLLRDGVVDATGEWLYQAVRTINGEDGTKLLPAFADSPDPVLRAEALRILREALHGGHLSPAQARTHLERLLPDPGALQELAEPWAALQPLPAGLLRPYATTEAGLKAAARHGHAHLLHEALGSEAPRLRRLALELLGTSADRTDIPALIATAAEDPVLLAAPLTACLSALHRRGHFVTDPAPYLAVVLNGGHVPAADVAAILFTCRHEVLRTLTNGVAYDDLSWPSRLAVLTGLHHQGTGDLPVGETVTALLPHAVRPAPFLLALGELRYAAAEEAVIAELPREPRTALLTLRHIGGPRTAAALRTALTGEMPAALRPFRTQALELLWQLTEDPAGRLDLVSRLDPHNLPPAVAADLGTPDPRELAVLAANLAPDRPDEALRTLARHGSAATVPAITDLLLRTATADVTVNPQLPENELGLRRHDHPEPAIPDEVADAVRELGRTLKARDRIRPAHLLDTNDPGNALLAGITLDLLERPGLGDAELAVLLKLLLSAPHRDTRARVHCFLRHHDPHVRKHTIALVARDPAGAAALAASLTQLTDAEDIQTVRQALLALKDTREAAPAIAACLDHRTMNIKKAAATALTTAGTPAEVPKLLHWLGHHDNAGFRTELINALRAILGDAFQATVRAAIDATDDTSERTLLAQAIAVRAPDDNSPSAVEQDVTALITQGWDHKRAIRLADIPDLTYSQLKRLRTLLPQWVALAATASAAAAQLLPRLCPEPWTEDETLTFRHFAPALALKPQHTHTTLKAVAPHLSADETRIVAETIRRRSHDLHLLRCFNATVTRADLERALTAAARGPNPWEAEEAALRAAFDIKPGTRDRLDKMIEQFPHLPADQRQAHLDAMEELQPIGAPPWTIAEETRRPQRPTTPDTTARRRELLTQLTHEDPRLREEAARELEACSDPHIKVTLLRAHLAGHIRPAETAADSLRLLTSAELNTTDAGVRDRIVGLLSATHELTAFIPLLLDRLRDGDNRAFELLRHCDPDALAARVDVQKHTELFSDRTLLRTADLERLDLPGVTLVDGPLLKPGTAAAEAVRSLATLRDRTPPEEALPLPRAELLARARTGDLIALAAVTTTGPDLEQVLRELLSHPTPAVRLHAHRTSRRLMEKPTYAEHTGLLLADSRPDIVRSAVRSLQHLRWTPAVPALVALLAHKHPRVREAAAGALTAFGPDAVPALRHALGKARPDRRHIYSDVLKRLT